MSSHVISKRKYPIELLERALNSTSLTVKRVHHGSIIGTVYNFVYSIHLVFNS